ncbi:MAG: carboxylating nicotinate-nucleotide diphosphorylase [Chloroflexota bacterium]
MGIPRLTPEEQIDKIIELALAEDLGQGDVTSEILIPPDLVGKAYILVKEEGVIAGLKVAEKVFRHVDPTLKVEILIKDGAKVKAGDITANVSGAVISILEAERTAINFVQKLSGVATATSKYVAQVQGLKTNIIDTRKTTPGMRLLEKYAVRMGGGKNHRLHLGDGILIKDNHLVALRAMGLSLKEIVAKAKKNAPKGIRVEVEATSLQEALDAAGAGADMILLDNMPPEEMKRVVSMLPSHVKTEASGGITLESVRAAALSGVDVISVGALTHSTKALNVSLELESQTLKLL